MPTTPQPAERMPAPSRRPPTPARRPPSASARAAQPQDGALLRLPVATDGWAEHLPPVPKGAPVTVSFTGEDLLFCHGDAVAALGYRVVGVAEEPVPEHPSADFLVEAATLAAHPTWARSLLDLADRAYCLAAGPVARLLEPTLAHHRR